MTGILSVCRQATLCFRATCWSRAHRRDSIFFLRRAARAISRWHRKRFPQWSCFTGGEVTVDCKLRRVIHAQHQLTRFYFSTFTMPHAPWPDKSLTNTKLFMNSLQRLMVFSLILFCVSAHAQTEQVGVWMKYEKTFESQKTYDNPLYDIRRFVVHFTSPTGKTKRINDF